MDRSVCTLVELWKHFRIWRIGNRFVFCGFPFQVTAEGWWTIAARPGGISPVALESFKSFTYCYCSVLIKVARWQGDMRPGKEEPVWLQDGSKEKSRAPKQHSLLLLWVPKPPTTVQPDSCVAGIKGTSQERPKRRRGRKTSLLSGIVLVIFHNLADNGWQCHCHPGPKTEGARSSCVTLRYQGLMADDVKLAWKSKAALKFAFSSTN